MRLCEASREIERKSRNVLKNIEKGCFLALKGRLEASRETGKRRSFDGYGCGVVQLAAGASGDLVNVPSVVQF
jgi:hypothetical protein